MKPGVPAYRYFYVRESRLSLNTPKPKSMILTLLTIFESSPVIT